MSKQESRPDSTQAGMLWVYSNVYPQPHTLRHDLQTLNNRITVFVEASLSHGLAHGVDGASTNEAQWLGALTQTVKQHRSQ